MDQQASCRVCRGRLREFLDLGRQPLSDAFVDPSGSGEEFFYDLVVAACTDCTMVQLANEVPRERMFHEDYPYVSSGSATMREHFGRTAEQFVQRELVGPDPFIVELGCNDGVLLRHAADAGIRHLGVEPSRGVARVAQASGVDVRVDFFELRTAQEIEQERGKADVIFAANTLCHIPYIDSVLEGVRSLLRGGGVFVFEDPYFVDILEQTSYDQIYDEHFYFFTATSVDNMARRFGLALVDVERLPVHGGEVRYSLAHAGTREPTPAVAAMIAEERGAGIADIGRLERFAEAVRTNSTNLVGLLRELDAAGKRVLGYGATAKSATVLNFAGVDSGLIEAIHDSTPAKQGRLTPGMHIPVRPPEAFPDPYPDYAVLFAWNHAAEIFGKEQGFRESGGQWILYVPDVHVV